MPMNGLHKTSSDGCQTRFFLLRNQQLEAFKGNTGDIFAPFRSVASPPYLVTFANHCEHGIAAAGMSTPSPHTVKGVEASCWRHNTVLRVIP